MFTQADHDFMAQALKLAARGMNTATPNPRVGCVIVKDHKVVGEGWHRRAGEPHAEIVALAQAAGQSRGAIAYLTLEPCSHFGRTPPCVDVLVEAKVARVICAMEDPNPLVNGRGLALLRAAGIDVRCGLLAGEARELNCGFVSRMSRGLPWVRLKAALSLDGRSALHNGSSKWITSEAARIDGHVWRARACAILTGIGTVRDDDPQLNVRHVDTTRQPLRVLVDSKLEVDLSAKVLRGGATLIACAVRNPDKERELLDRGCEVICLPNEHNKVQLPELLGRLAKRGINELHVEAGHKLNGSLLREGCVDELLIYLAPMLLGDAHGLAQLQPMTDVAQGLPLRFHDIERVGKDLRIVARVARGDALTASDGNAQQAAKPLGVESLSVEN